MWPGAELMQSTQNYSGKYIEHLKLPEVKFVYLLLVKPKKSVQTSLRPGGIDLRNFFAMKMSPPHTVKKSILNTIIEKK